MDSSDKEEESEDIRGVEGIREGEKEEIMEGEDKERGSNTRRRRRRRTRRK